MVSSFTILRLFLEKSQNTPTTSALSCPWSDRSHPNRPTRNPWSELTRSRSGSSASNPTLAKPCRISPITAARSAPSPSNILHYSRPGWNFPWRPKVHWLVSPDFLPPARCDFSYARKGNGLFKDKTLDKGLFPFLAWEKQGKNRVSQGVANRGSGLTN